MTKEEYIAMKTAGQYSLPCFYQYYADHITEAQDSTLRTFEEFSAAFPAWWNQPTVGFSSGGIINRVQAYFDGKFGITRIDNVPKGEGKAVEDNWNPFGHYAQNNGL